jgi:hypothetical protein
VVGWFPAGGVNLGEVQHKAHAPETIVARIQAQMVQAQRQGKDET